MSSLVSDFLINPVLRQARRFSEISRPAVPVVEPDSQSDQAVALSDSEQPMPASRDSAVIPPEPFRLRPLSSSTQSTSVDQPPSDPVDTSPQEFPIIVPMPTVRGAMLPEDDGMGILRSRLRSIQLEDIPGEEKARLMHEALMEGYRRSKIASRGKDTPTTGLPAGEAWEQSVSLGPLEALKFWQHSPGEPSNAEKFVLTADDVRPTYTAVQPSKDSPEDHGNPDDTETIVVLGCQHYRRNVKLQCSTCHKWHTCRFCHDAVENHALIRKETKNMLCMLCACPQRASDVCVNCGESAARYYCSICKLWDDHPSNSIYHCNDCGICRRGRGIGKDFFHCKKCCACISMSIEKSHKCIERSTDCDCPICGDYMFTSPKPVVFMSCGHSIHQGCYNEHMKTSYKCPICNKSLLNMQSQFRQLELAIQSQPMPAEFRDTRVTVLCNDCSGKSSVPYHWLGLKCAICTSYNTVELQISSGNTRLPSEVVVGAPETAPEITPAPPTEEPHDIRRRHSSHGRELRHMIPDRLARSASPPLVPGLTETPANTAGDAEDSEDDMLGFWGPGHASDSEDDSDYGLDGADDDEDDDDEDDVNEIVLFGHR